MARNVRGYVGAGHGQEDPGAVKGKLVENTLALKVVQAVKEGLQRSGVTPVRYENRNHDPRLAESIHLANDSGAEWAVEVHFNAGGGHGAEAFIKARGGDAEQLANKIMRVLPKRVGLAARRPAVKTRSDLGWLNYTQMPAVLVEVEFLDGANRRKITDKFCRIAGEAIAEGICGYLGETYVKPGRAAPPKKPPANPTFKVSTRKGSRRNLATRAMLDQVEAWAADGTTPVLTIERQQT